MLRSLSMPQNKTIEVSIGVSNNCKNRIVPPMLSDVKTEALLVFARTALERYFIHLQENNLHPAVGSQENTEYVYGSLARLRDQLQESVVNADYLVNLVQSAKIYPQLRALAKHEEPLINYYDVMSKNVANYYMNKSAYIPEFLVICVLHAWIVEEERSIKLYPFLSDYDFDELIHRYEINREEFQKEGECMLADTFNITEILIQKLKSKKYKVNRERVSKTRKKK